LDAKIKSGLVLDTLNLVGVRKYDRRRDNLTKMKNRVKNIMRAKSYQSRQSNPASAIPTKHAQGEIGPQQNSDKKKQGNNQFGHHNEEFCNESDYFMKNKQLFEKLSQINNRFRDVIRETL
jgi:hypothetical protein